MLTIEGDQFLLDGTPFRILSGAMHYFRVLPEYWRDRLEKMRAFGLNTVETYVAWNLHEPRPGEFRFSGQLDLVQFIHTAAEVGLKVIVRPGPYICSEWEFGGLPSWLLKDPCMQVRCSYPPYLEAIERYYATLLPRLVQLQATHGGPILAMQVENEYGSFGNDAPYLQYLVDSLRRHEVDGLLLTSDGPEDGNLQGGRIPGILPTVNFAFDAAAAFAKLRVYHPRGPLMVMELWAGWFDHWGEAHHLSADGSTSLERSVQTLEDVLAAGASVNLYMFHGGTNFGFMNGANYEWNLYQADITSYDYAAPLDEAGDPSPRFAAYAEVLRKYVSLPPLAELPSAPKRSFGPVALTSSVGLLDALEALSQPQRCVSPLPMEMFDQDYGFILYRTCITGPRPASILQVHGLHDRALVCLDGQVHATLERETNTVTDLFDIPPAGRTLDILVENMGRVTFGAGMLDRKGILEGVSFGGQLQFRWEVFPLPLDDLHRLQFAPLDGSEQTSPTFYRASFEVDTPADTFLALPGWTKGVVWINGFNLGRYWARGPQKTLYVPAPLLRAGPNELVVFELHGTTQLAVVFRDTPDLG